MVNVISGKVSINEQSIMASPVMILNEIPNYFPMAWTVFLGPAIREVPESIIPMFNPVQSAPSVEIDDKETGQ